MKKASLRAWFGRPTVGPVPHGRPPFTFWARDEEEVLRLLEAGREGLTSVEAATRLREHGHNELREEQGLSRARVLWTQLRNPLLLILLFAIGASAAAAEWADGAIVLTIVLATVGIGYHREYRAQSAVAALRRRIRHHTEVLRDGRAQSVPAEELVPGDIVLLSAGALVPADALILEASDCHVSEAALTGESFPVRKTPGRVAADTPLAKRSNALFLGTNIRTGTARAVVVRTGSATEFGGIAHRLSLRPPDTEFERGVRRFGYLLTSAMMVVVVLVLVAHALRGVSSLETLLFAVALAVGLSPELLPAILSVNLARAAQAMARRGVLVRRLNAIENLGSMDVLCTDKTGTLTEGVVKLQGAFDPAGSPSPSVLALAGINASLQKGLPSPLDDAIVAAQSDPEAGGVPKLAEIPFDFVRKRVSVVAERPDGPVLVTKGAFPQVAAVCSRLPSGLALDPAGRAELDRRYREWTSRGIRVLAVASARPGRKAVYGRDDERDLTFEGFLAFFDRPKEGVADAIVDLRRLGVSLKLISGDSKLVALHLAGLVGLRADGVVTGAELDELNDEALWNVAVRTDLFVEVDPHQKERIISALRKMGHVVGFLGDGINDAPAMHAADTSISVEEAVDVAREAADFVLLERHLDVIRRGIEEGRKTFANTLKYLLTTTSANLGNMVSMAVASVFLPFLPMLAGQILLNNFLSDIPAIGVADDRVDPELVDAPRRWDIRFIARFMVEFGALSSLIDLATFALLLYVFQAGVETFRTGWFVESLLTELVIALVVRTRRPFFRSRPGRLLLGATLVLIPLTLVIPYAPFAETLGFVPLPGTLVLVLVSVTALYVLLAELLKRWFYRTPSLVRPRPPAAPIVRVDVSDARSSGTA